MLDLTQQYNTKAAAERGFDVILKHPATKQPFIGSDKKPIFIKLLGSDADKLRKLSREILDRHFEAQRKGDPKGTKTAEANETELVERFAAATIAWHSDIARDGAPLSCTEANAVLLYGDPRVPWILDQLMEEYGDRSRFFSESSAS